MSDLISVFDHGPSNQRRYTHNGCEWQDPMTWTSPLDDCLMPTEAECPGCIQMLPCRRAGSVQAAQGFTEAQAEVTVGPAPGEVHVWTDGSGTSEGPWGSCAIMLFRNKSGLHRRELITFGDEGTNNVAELSAVILALEELKRRCRVKVYTDSEYVMYGFAPCDGQPCGRVERWKRKNWINSQKEPVKNKELWLRLDAAVTRHTDVTWEHVDGHTGIELNERCDELAGRARKVAKGELTLADLFAVEEEEAEAVPA